MKHYFSFLTGCIVCGALLVGCSNKSSNNSMILECNSTKTFSNSLSEVSYKIHFDNDNVDRLSLNINITLNEQDDVTRNNLENEVNSAFANYKNRDGVSYSSNIKDDGFVIKMDINYNKLSDVDKSYITIINSEKSYNEIKMELENADFTCK